MKNLIMIMLLLITSCSEKIVASTNQGLIVDVYQSKKGYYANVVLKGKKGYADYNYWNRIYFPYKVNSNEEVLLITKSHLDSLINNAYKELR